MKKIQGLHGHLIYYEKFNECSQIKQMAYLHQLHTSQLVVSMTVCLDGRVLVPMVSLQIVTTVIVTYLLVKMGCYYSFRLHLFIWVMGI